MLNAIETINTAVNNFIWGVPAMVCIIGVGLYLSIRTGFLQILFSCTGSGAVVRAEECNPENHKSQSGTL